MSDVDWMRAAELFADARELPPAQQAGFVAEQSGDDEALAGAVLRLLRADAVGDAVFPAGLDDELVHAAVLDAEGTPASAGPWRLVRQIGQGGMGQVYLAQRTEGGFEQRAAVKVLKRGMDSAAILARFLRERRILAGLEHPNIARLLDGGIATDGRPYFALEYVEGAPVTVYADEHHLTVDERLALFQEVCLAIEYAHRNLVVHRDLKPSNILVTADGRPKLVDFGIAKLLAPTGDDSILTEAGVRLLTPEYAAPEQFHGGAVTTQTDVYGAGAVLYELLAGARPREGKAHPPPVNGDPPSLSAALSGASSGAVAAARATDPARLRRRLAGDLEVIVATALRTEPARRYPSIAALREDLRLHGERLPVKARPDTAGYRLSRFVRRHRAGVAAGAVIALLVLGFAITAAVQGARIRRQAVVIAGERDRARQEAAAARQVSDFLVGVFEVSDPMRTSVGDSITARALLDRGAERIGSDLAGQPALEARLLSVIGLAYHNLGHAADAERLVQRAADLEGRNAEALPATQIALLQQLAQVRVRGGNYRGALATIGEAIALQETLDPAGPAMIGLLADLANTQHGDGNLPAAQASATRALAAFHALAPGAGKLPVNDLRSLTQVFPFAGEAPGADAVHALLVETEAAASGPRREPVAAAYGSWASTRLRQGDARGADSLLRLSLGIHAELGMRSPGAAYTLSELGRIAEERGDIEAADSLYRESVEVYRRVYGDGHFMVASVQGALAALLQRGGRYPEAIALYQAVIASYAASPERHRYVPVAEWRLAETLRQAGRREAALATFGRALAGHEAHFPRGYLLTAQVRRDYGRALLDAGRPADAEPLLRTALTDLTARWGEQDERVEEVRSLLARASASGERGTLGVSSSPPSP